MFWRKDTPFVMGILNVTPDSFYDGGKYQEKNKAVEKALSLFAGGADVVDVGGESTRPGARFVSAQEEAARVLPVLKEIRAQTPQPLSLDTSKEIVARQALELGAADMVNDVTALRGDPNMAATVARFQVPVILMHMQGSPQTMQTHPAYTDVVQEICDFFKERIAFACSQGISKDKILIDPGIGFGKTLAHNLELLRRLEELAELGVPVVVGPSRKSFIGMALGNMQVDRIWGTASAVAVCVLKGACAVRVHDVAEMRQVITIAEKLKNQRKIAEINL